MQTVFTDTRILIFTKLPLPGKCKSRLIEVLGKNGAANLQAKLVKKIIMDLSGFNLCPFEIWQSEPGDYFSQWLYKRNIKIPVHFQQGKDLGMRMVNAIEQTLREVSNVIIIGSDCLLYSYDYLATAITRLQNNDVVIGPATDGGYVLIGMQQVFPMLFDGIHWGTDSVFEQTVAKLQAEKHRYHCLETLWDIDRSSDLNLVRQISPEIMDFSL
ncbi:MAG TPA: glycosyltransferase [Gammaproteobacteria bacterium]|nr:glycosyltransferase [Gammaproteobacteria bacterium]